MGDERWMSLRKYARSLCVKVKNHTVMQPVMPLRNIVRRKRSGKWNNCVHDQLTKKSMAISGNVGMTVFCRYCKMLSPAVRFMYGIRRTAIRASTMMTDHITVASEHPLTKRIHAIGRFSNLGVNIISVKFLISPCAWLPACSPIVNWSTRQMASANVANITV